MVLKNMDYNAKNGDSVSHASNRLLDAAERLFCERGFDGTSVRDLTKAAQCNVAAVNYHFGNKENLYEQMFRRHLKEMFDEHRQNIERVMNGSETSLERFLESLVRTALEKLSTGDTQIPLMKLITRECLNPQLKHEVVALDMVKEFLEKVGQCLQKLVPGLDEKKAMMYVFSIEALLMHPMLFYDLYSKLFWTVDIDELTGHIVKFAAAGIREAAQE
jgi:AcrR family transcriptional regulator